MANNNGGGNTTGRRSSFGNIRKLSSGRFQARYTGPDHAEHRAPVTFQTKGDAAAFLALRHAEIIRHEWMPPEMTTGVVPVTFEEFATDWLAHRPLKPLTRANYQRILDRFLTPAFGARPVAEMTRSEVREWYGSLSPDTPTMRAQTYGLLRTVLNSAVAEEIITINPVYIRGAGNVERAREPRPASVEELALLVEALPKRYRLMALLAGWCALRFGELVELRVKDVDLEEQIVRVRRAAVRVNGKTIVGTPKSRAGTRDVCIPPHLLPEVVAHLAELSGTGRERLLFPARDGVSTLKPSSLYRVYYPARTKAGRPDLKFHDLRHTAAVLAAQTGATLAELMVRLGHSTPGAALRYQHAAEGRDRQIAARLSELALVRPEKDDPLADAGA